MKAHRSMKEALALAPMDQCALPFRSPNREWWRYGWALGFLGRNYDSFVQNVREKRYRDATRIGFTAGCKARAELECSGAS